MKRLAGGELIVVVPVVVDVVEVHAPLAVVVLVEVRDVAIAVRIAQKICDAPSITLPIEFSPG